MFKKITLSAATLALSVGLFGTTVGAEEIAQPATLPNQNLNLNLNQLESSNIITPYAAQVSVTRYDYFSKKQYPVSYETPDTLFVSEMINNSPYGGNLKKIKVEAYGLDMWKVTYQGLLTRFEL